MDTTSIEEIPTVDEGLNSPEETIPPTIVTLTNPHWCDADNTIIGVDVEFSHRPDLGVSPYSTYNPSDSDYGQLVWDSVVVDGTYDEIAPFVPAQVSPLSCPLTGEQFYEMLDSGLGKFDDFAAAIETVAPASKKITCRNQFNNSTTFTWDMVLMALVAPKVWGEAWQDEVSPAWIAAAGL